LPAYCRRFRNFNREEALHAVERIRERRKGVTLGGIKIKDLIEEGRE